MKHTVRVEAGASGYINFEVEAVGRHDAVQKVVEQYNAENADTITSGDCYWLGAE